MYIKELEWNHDQSINLLSFFKTFILQSSEGIADAKCPVLQYFYMCPPLSPTVSLYPHIPLIFSQISFCNPKILVDFWNRLKKLQKFKNHVNVQSQCCSTINKAITKDDTISTTGCLLPSIWTPFTIWSINVFKYNELFSFQKYSSITWAPPSP